MGRNLIFSALVLALGATALQWLNYRMMVAIHTSNLYVFLIGAACLGFGIWVGASVFARRMARPFDGNPKGVAALGLSRREQAVLSEIAQGYTNKEIARRLGISPETVKSHVSNLYEKLEARGRIEAVSKARLLGIVP